AARHRQLRRPRVNLLHGPRAGRAAAVRLLRRGFHALDDDVQSRRADRGGRVPRTRRTHLRAAGRALARRRSRGGREAMTAALLALAVVAGARVEIAQADAAATRILVMPFENLKRDG